MTFASSESKLGRGSVPDVAETVDAHTRARRRLECAQHAARRPGGAVALHRFHVDAQLHRVSARAQQRILQQADLCERRASGDAQLRLDEIDAEDFFRNRVLHLQPGIRFDECETLAAASVHQELERAGILVTDLLRHLQSRLDQLAPRRVRERRARRDLDDLLMTSLQGALAVP